MAKLKREASEIPQSREEASAWLAEIGALERALTIADADCKEVLARVKAKFEANAAPNRERIETLSSGLQAFCEGRRAELTEGKSKVIQFAAGVCFWRKRPPSVVAVPAKLLGKVIEQLKRRKLDQFIRVKEELNKEAILAQPKRAARVPGIAIDPGGEDFLIEAYAPKGLEARP